MAGRVRAVILAGRANRGAFAGVSEAEWEALLPLAGRPMLSHLLAAVRCLPGLERVAVVGPPAIARCLAGEERVDCGEGLVANVRRGIEAVGTDLPILILSCDIPLVTGPILADFLAEALPVGADLCYPIVERALCDRRFPGTRRTYVRLRDGTFTGGNAFLVDGRAALRSLDLLDRFYAARKSPWRLAALVGPAVLWGLVTGRLAIAQAEERVRRLAGIEARALRFAHPEIALDVDKPEDLALAERVLSAREVGA